MHREVAVQWADAMEATVAIRMSLLLLKMQMGMEMFITDKNGNA
jgi:hypothetical protein